MIRPQGVLSHLGNRWWIQFTPYTRFDSRFGWISAISVFVCCVPCNLHSHSNIFKVSGTLRQEPRACLALGRLSKRYLPCVRDIRFVRTWGIISARTCGGLYLGTAYVHWHIKRFIHHSQRVEYPFITQFVLSNVLYVWSDPMIKSTKRPFALRSLPRKICLPHSRPTSPQLSRWSTIRRR